MLEEAAKILAQPPAPKPMPAGIKASAAATGTAPGKTETPAAKTEAAPGPKSSASQVDVRVGDTPADVPLPDPRIEPLRALAALPADLLALALDSENSRTISLLINSLDIEVAGELYKRLSAGKRKEVSQRFTEQPIVNDALIQPHCQRVVRKCQALPCLPRLGRRNPEVVKSG